MFKGARVARFAAIQPVAMRKLAMLNQAGRLDDLRVPPGNRLQALKGDRTGQHSIPSTISGACASAGRTATRKMSRSWTITNPTSG
jgi:hypothetical protein